MTLNDAVWIGVGAFVVVLFLRTMWNVVRIFYWLFKKGPHE